MKNVININISNKWQKGNKNFCSAHTFVCVCNYIVFVQRVFFTETSKGYVSSYVMCISSCFNSLLTSCIVALHMQKTKGKIFMIMNIRIIFVIVRSELSNLYRNLHVLESFNFERKQLRLFF